MSPDPVRRIAHLDMDAFFASVELLRYPQLKGLPVVIGGGRRAADQELRRDFAERALDAIPVHAFPRLRDYAGRGVITTATYAARQFGIGSAMGLMRAARLCPDAILLPVDFEQYRHYSRAFKDIVRELAPLIEERGIDEVFIDFTAVGTGQLEGGRVLAQQIQQRILADLGLSCSIGVAPNKLIAKMASELDKPQGISILFEADVETRIWPLPCRKIHGIGPRTDARLTALGIATIGQLAGCERPWLIEQFGPNLGSWLFAAAHGQDDRPVITHSEPVSMSRETTFERDLHAVRDRNALSAIFTRLCQQVAADLQRKGYAARTVAVKLRYADFRIVTRAQSGADHTADAATIRKLAGQALKRAPLDKPLRLLGVRVAALRKLLTPS